MDFQTTDGTAPPKQTVRNISNAAFRRLPRYHQILSAFEGLGRKHISSKELSDVLEINETLVRKDMADLEVRGRQNQGYAIEPLRKRIEEYLGLREVTEAILVGAGHLGKALAQYPGFEHYGLKIVSVLDNDPEKIGSTVGSHIVSPISLLPDIIARHTLKLLVLTVPKANAQEVTDLAVRAGIRAVWNFTPQELSVPEGIRVRNEQIVAGFMALSYYLKTLSQNESRQNQEDNGQ